MSPEYVRLSQLIATQPTEAWAGLVAFVAGGGELLEAEALLEDLVANHPAAFLDAIESETAASNRFSEVVAYSTVHEVGGPAIDRFHQIQRRMRDELGVSYWEGSLPFGENQPR
jgi:hypothetical protein